MPKRTFEPENDREAMPGSEKRRELGRNDVQTPTVSAASGVVAPNDYTVGWICAISTEAVAARVFLDEKHEGPEFVSAGDNNVYTLGKLGRHNVVIAVLPEGEYGTDSAASVATNMLNSFPNVRIGLMVGIGGGAPIVHDIRLGDIVVSAPRGGYGGVFQYDFGKAIQDQNFEHTRFLNQPPELLRAAISDLKANYEIEGHRIEENIDKIFEKYPRLRGKYQRPGSGTDKLFKTEITHDKACAIVCSDDLPNLISRPERTKEDDNPAIHYGLIASANQLMKDALARDKLAAEKDVLCFEMEAAGLINRFPCLVIRGICDYSDSHKNKEWQGYAAMAAAAYAKDLLCRIPPGKIEAEKKIGDILHGLHEVAQAHLDVEKSLLQAQEDFAKERLSDKEAQCHQVFRLTADGSDSTYEWYKSRVESRVKGTCLWLLEHKHFQSWLKQDSGPLLVSADPGCGKSVLAKYLIDKYLPQSATICYFFFKDKDQNTVQQALCALLHQLFSHQPSLIKHAMPQFLKDGERLIKSTASLWEVLQNAVKDPKAGPIIIVLDALDECAEREFADLMREIESQFYSGQPGYGKLKYLLTSRPYEQIVSKFSGLLETFPNIRIPGEAESETISQEVNRVITHRVGQLSMKKRLSPQIKSYLETRLQQNTHRTYLWVYLVFDYLESEHFKKTLRGVESTIAALPKNVNEAYEQILNKSKDHPMVRKALSIILAASRPLTISEMNVAVNIDDKAQSIDDLDLEDEEDFERRLRSSCGLFISIYHTKIYFLHQTAREFLLTDLLSPSTTPLEPRWHHSISAEQAHAVLAELCVLYLKLFNSDVSLPKDAVGEGGHFIDRHALLDYSAENWGAHFRKAGIIDAAIIPSALKICDPNSKSYSAWFRIYWNTTSKLLPNNFTGLMVASYLGLTTVVRQLLRDGADIKAKDTRYCRTPLSWAAEGGHEAVVTLLLESGMVDVNSKDKHFGLTPLWYAVEKGFNVIVELLLRSDADVNSRDNYLRLTPLRRANNLGYKAIVDQLYNKGGVDTVSEDPRYDQTILSNAAEMVHVDPVNIELEPPADSDITWYGQFRHKPCQSLDLEYFYLRDQLADAAKYNNWEEAEVLLNRGQRDYNQNWVNCWRIYSPTAAAEDLSRFTPLHQAAWWGNKLAAQKLLQRGAWKLATSFNSPPSERYSRPLDVARDRGFDVLYDVLNPEVEHPRNREILKALEDRLHRLIRHTFWKEPGAQLDCFILPQLDILTEFKLSRMWFPLNPELDTHGKREGLGAYIILDCNDLKVGVIIQLGSEERRSYRIFLDGDESKLL